MKKILFTLNLLLCAAIAMAQPDGGGPSGGGPGSSGSSDGDDTASTVDNSELLNYPAPDPGKIPSADFIEYTSNGWSLLTNGPETVMWATCMSPNGRFVSCWLDSGVGQAFLDMFEGTYYERTGSGEGSGISNDGTVVGTCGTYNLITGSAPRGNGMAISTDGTIIAGNSIYNNGKTYSLPRPTEEQVGGEYQGMSVIGVSDDAKVVCGYIINWFLGYGMVLWFLNDNDEYELYPWCGGKMEMEFSGDRPYYELCPTALSRDGKWVAMTVSENDGTLAGGTTHAVWYDVENDSIIEPEELFTCSSTRMSDAGEMLVHTGEIDSQSRKAMIWKLGDPSPVYLAEMYPDVPEFADYDLDTWNYGTGISADGRFICGMGWHYIEGYDEYYARRVSWYFDREAYNLPVDEGISRTNNGLTITSEQYFSIDGKRLPAPQKGLNIVKTNNDTKKVLVK